MQAGTRLSHYEIQSPLGRGGMGEVWLALDTRLRRQVAVKLLPEVLAHDPGRLARLEREAELLATLNHPNIGGIYGLEEDAGTRFLVLELVDGVTLDDRILRGAVPLDDALRMAIQIALGVEAAHDKGVVHRDLKPSNIKLTSDSQIKVLDFGLARAFAPAPGAVTTAEMGRTKTGAVMGTPAYMSPEQARGEPIGTASDIWAFGVVLYELLSGKSAFRRSSTAETLASVLEARPDYSVLPAGTPEPVRRTLRRCLARDPHRRLHHMADVRLELEEALTTLDDPVPRAASTTARPGRNRSAWAAGLALAALGVAGGWALATRTSSAPLGNAIRAEIDFPGQPPGLPLGARHLAISADGVRLGFTAEGRLWIRRVDETAFVPIASGFVSNPFFSPDGEWVAGFNDANLVKARAGGGATVTIAASSDRPLGGAWGRNGTIVFATSEALYQVPAEGGAVKLLMRPYRSRGELLYAWPELLADESAVLVTVVPPNGVEGGFQVVKIDLKTLTRSTVLPVGSAARYVSSGHLVYASGPSLQAVRFDPVSGTTQGAAIALPGIDMATAADNGAANFAVSDTGTLVYTNPRRLPPRTLQWVDRAGLSTPLEIAPDNYVYPRVSPDGTRAAIERTIRGNRDIWIVDLARLTLTQLTDGPTEDMMPIWSADGQRVFFASRRAGNFDIYSQAADGATGAKVEFAGPEFQTPVAVTPDGRHVIVYERFQDLSLLDLAKPDRLQPLLHGPADERLADISPDGQWIAYESSESGGGSEILLRPFPNVNDRREKISQSGGRYPAWGPKGSDRLYYQDPDGRMMAVPVRLSPTLTIGTAVPLFTWQKPPAGRSGQQFHLSPVDGRFLMTKPTETRPGGPTTVSLVMNWTALLDGRTGTAR
jgi:hypothetical protein